MIHTPPSPSERDTDAARLGSEIREVRKARGMTLRALSHEIGCSLAYLSRVERGTAQVSVALLTSICDVLAVERSWFFPTRDGDGPLERSYVVRGSARRDLSGMYTRSTQELGFSDELLSSTLSGGCYLLLSRFPAGAGAEADVAEMPEVAEGYVFEGEQHGLVLSGEIRLELGEEIIILKAGDSFSYPSTIPHRFHNNGESEATMVWAMAPVRISW